MLQGRRDTLRCRSVTVAVSVLMTASGAFAQSTTASDGAASREPLPVEVTIEPAFCGRLDDVEREVTRRSPRVHFVSPTGSRRRQVSLGAPASAGAGRVGATVVLRTGSEQQSRELWAKSCDDLVRAVGFIISVTYDPPSPELVEPNGEASTGADAVNRESTETEPNPAPASLVEPTNRESSLEIDDLPERNPDREAGRWRGGLGGAAVWGMAPSATVGAVGFVALSVGAVEGLGAMARVMVGGDFASAQPFEGGEAEFQRWSGQLLVGPEWHVGGFDLGIGATGRAGVIRAQGRSTTEPRSYDRLWLDVGGSVVARLGLSPHWSLEAEVGVSKPLTRYAFQFDPVVFHRVSSWLGHVGLAASVGF